MKSIEECISNIHVNYHRNGISGEGFYAIHFVWQDMDEPYCSGSLIATVVPHPENAKDKLKCNGKCFVVNITNPEQCYRGDNFEPTMRKILEAHDIDWHDRLYTDTAKNTYVDKSVSYYNTFQNIRETVVNHKKEKVTNL